MKPSTVILYVAVTLSLILSLTTLIIVTQNNNTFTPNSPTTTPEYTEPPTITSNPPTEPPTITSIPLSPSTQPETSLTVTYTETNREEDDGTTKVTLTVDVTYNNGNDITIKYSEFYLQLYTPRMIVYMAGGKVAPINSGSFNLDPSHKTQTFQLDFAFSTMGFNGMDAAPHVYQLAYSGPATVQWTNHGSTKHT